MGGTAGKGGGDPAVVEAEDAAWVLAAQANRQAFGPLYERYVESIYRYCFHRLGAREAAEDATSLVFTKALSALSRFRPDEGSFRSWLFVIAHNTVADVRRARQTVPLVADERVEISLGPEESVIEAQDLRALHRLLAELPEHQRRVMELRLSGLSSPEVGRILGRSPTAIRSLQFRAVAQLRSLLADAVVVEESRHVRR